LVTELETLEMDFKPGCEWEAVGPYIGQLTRLKKLVLRSFRNVDLSGIIAKVGLTLRVLDSTLVSNYEQNYPGTCIRCKYV
jgi:hypothetical protein